MVRRLLEATASDFATWTGRELAEAIRLSEGRTLAAEVLLSAAPPVDGVTHGELAAAMGADIIALDGYDVSAPRIPGWDAPAEAPLAAYSLLLGLPVGINLVVAAPQAPLGGKRATPAALEAAADQGADVLFVYARPHMGGTLALHVEAVQQAVRHCGERVLLVAVPPFALPPPRDAASSAALRDYTAALLDAGAGAVAFPMPGTRQGWTLDAAAARIDQAQAAGALAWLFVTGSIESAPAEAMTALALQAKQIGADAVRLDEAGLAGLPAPENILAFSLALRGARHTYRRMARGSRR